MAEIANVVSGNTITSAWGNQIRDRAIMRYANAAARTASIPTPTAGDLAFMQDSGLVWVYFSGAWRPVGATGTVDGTAAISYSTTGTYADAASVSLTIPTYWASWSCTAWGSWQHSAGGGSAYRVRMRIDGTDGSEITGIPVGTAELLGNLQGFQQSRTGMTTTGARTVALRSMDDGPSVLLTGALYARATQTS